MSHEAHEKYIQECFEIAKEYTGLTSPNPIVASIIVKNEKIISTGVHKKSGTDHAERDAILKISKENSEELKGATLYCNLEPCCHTNKKTPPCTQKIIEVGISKVVISNLDPNPAVAGKGIKLLRDAGIEVITGILEEEGLELNRIFFHHIQSELPYIHLKWAQSIDGKLATKTNHSQWITNEKSREYVHLERLNYDAIMVGASTARLDNPKLTVRRQGEIIKAPYRLVVSGSGNIDESLEIFQDQYKERTILITANTDKNLESSQVMHCLNNKDGRIDLKPLLIDLKERGLNSIYIEGGPNLLTQFIKEKLFNEISIYIGSKLIGAGKDVLGDIGVSEVTQGEFLSLKEKAYFGDDIFLNYRMKECLQD